MINTVTKVVYALDSRDRKKYIYLLSMRSLLTLLDLFAILAIGLLGASVAVFASTGSAQGKSIAILGFSVPAISSSTLPILIGVVLFIFIVKSILAVFFTNKIAVTLGKIETNIANKIIRSIYNRRFDFTEKYSIEDIYYIIQICNPAAFNYILNHVATICSEGILFFVIVSAFFLVDATAAMLALLYFCLLAFIMHYVIGKRIEESSQLTTESTRATYSHIRDLNDVIKESTLLNTKEYFFDRIKSSKQQTANHFARQYTLNSLPRYVIETGLLLAMAFYFGLISRNNDLIQVATSISIFLAGGLRLTASLLPLQNALLSLKGNIPPARMAIEAYSNSSTENEITNRKSEISLNDIITPRIELKDVWFRYPNSSSQTLTNINLEIEPGRQVAIIGRSGSGKTTLAEIILGIRRPDSGSVILDGVELVYPPYFQRGLLSYVPQVPGMVNGSIRENILLGADESNLLPGQLEAAIASAQLSELIDSLPKGLDSELGKQKNDLSVGQLQRIGLARAFLSKPRIVVLDEATSALDAESEDKIRKALDEIRGEITVILIAHRLNTIQHSDIVLLIEEGELIATGEFSKLIKTNSRVKNFADIMAIREHESLDE